MDTWATTPVQPFHRNQPKMMTEYQYSKIPLMAIIALCMPVTWLPAQQFRQPTFPQSAIPAPQQTPDGLQGRVIRGNVGPADKFVPNTSNESLGFVPVRPRNGSLNESDTQVLGSRTAEQERILEKIREGNFVGDENGFERQSGPQIIRKRYDNGKDHLVRQVMQDETGNFYNHGPWQLYNRRGDLMASGQFVEGLMDGTWERWHMGKSGGIFATKPFSDFEGPYISTATFKNGKLNGTWVISDQYRRKIVEVPYRNGKRHGNATWWFPSSDRMRVITFKDGVLDGSMYEWDEKKKLVRNDEFINGQKVIRQRTMYRPKQPSGETYYLDAELSLESDDNWWDAEPADYVQLGQRIQHGPTFAWHSNGLRKMVGQYKNNVRVGPFTWWHENGQRSLAGKYDEEGRKTGVWSWWHSNGMKSIEGTYDVDEAVGKWTWWDENGQVEDRQDLGEAPESNGVLVNPLTTESENEDANGSQAKQKSNPPAEGIDTMEDISPQNIEDYSTDIDDSDDSSESIDPDQSTNSGETVEDSVILDDVETDV